MLKQLTKTLKKSFVFLFVLGAFSVAMAEPPKPWGVKFVIPYMPYGSGLSQIIYVSNETNTTSSFNVKAFDDEGNKFEIGNNLSVDAAAEAVTRLQDALRTAIEDEGYDGGTARITFELVIDNPDINIFAAYNVRGDRLKVDVIKTYILNDPNPKTDD